jgi:transcription elongation factor
MRFALITGLFGLAISSAIGQSTNIVQPAYFVLKGTIQTQTASGVKSIRVVNKDIIAALNETGVYQFGPRATLLFITTDEQQPPELMVRDVSAGTVTTNDIGNYFGITEVGDEVRSPDNSTRWQTWNFAFSNGITNDTGFQLWGATTIQRGAVHSARNGEVTGTPVFISDVRGAGGVQGTNTIFSGTIYSANSTPVASQR